MSNEEVLGLEFWDVFSGMVGSLLDIFQFLFSIHKKMRIIVKNSCEIWWGAKLPDY